MKFFAKIYRLLALSYFIILFLNACNNYYKPTALNPDTASVEKMQMSSRYFILRSGERFYHMTNISLSKDGKYASTILEPVSSDHLLYINSSGYKDRTYNKDTAGIERAVLNEVHLFMETDSSVRAGRYTVDLSRVTKMELIEKDRKRTTNSHILSGVGVTAGIILVAVIIIAATKSSCPFVSGYDGKGFSLQGEMFGGAINSNLERHDYLPLELEPFPDSTLQLKIHNELKEHQFTNFAELWEITHDKDLQVIADESGNLFGARAPVIAKNAMLNNKYDVTRELKNKNDGLIAMMDDSSVLQPINEVMLDFQNRESAKNGTLILRLKNSYFLDLLYGELAKGFGSYYPTYIRQQGRKPASELIKWCRDQRIPLTVEAKTSSGWKKVAELTTIGPLANRTVAIGLHGMEGSSTTSIRLSSGFMFWEIDYAAIDYGSKPKFTIKKLRLSSAVDEKGNDVSEELASDDSRYLSQPEIGNCATLSFRSEPLKDISKTRTYILHSKGYYLHLRDFRNKPDISFLRQFKKPKAFPAFGLRLFRQYSMDLAKNSPKIY